MFYLIDSTEETMNDVYCIHKATYYSTEQTDVGNVMDTLKTAMEDYFKNKKPIIVSNELFTDTHYGVEKKLWIEIKNTISGKIHKYTFCEGALLDFERIFKELDDGVTAQAQTQTSLKIDVSIGEVVDKYSILELKLENINDESKREGIRLEMSLLQSHVDNIKPTTLYRMLIYINGLIWNDSDTVKELLKNYDETNSEHVSRNAKLSNKIFENNQKRFRIKQLLNNIYSSYVKEYKSYAEEICYITARNSDDIYSKVPEINYLCITYDRVLVNVQYKDVFQTLFHKYNISFVEEDITSLDKYDLSIYSLDIDIRDVFDIEPIIYASGGKLGDFLNQLSVICENYYKTGRKGILYIANTGDYFTLGLEHTYNDTRGIIEAQKYIKEYKIHNGELVNINLSSWRDNHVYQNWKEMYRNAYDIDWGKHKWIEHPVIDEKWQDKIIINLTFRALSESSVEQIKTHLEGELDNCAFVSNEAEYYNTFCRVTGFTIPHYMPADFTEIVTIVNSCKMRYLGFSSMAVVANALHKPHYLIGASGVDCVSNSLEGIIPHVLGVLI